MVAPAATEPDARQQDGTTSGPDACRMPVGEEEFAALMAPLGPWAGLRRIGVAVSGGADSLACALLVRAWAMSRGAETVALVVDHGLRPGSEAEAATTLRRLEGMGIEARLERLRIGGGPALAERARAARYAALTRLAVALGLLDLVLGHHAGDQAETVLMRERAGSGADGLAGMALLRETLSLRLLRPLLCVPPERLRATLRRAALAWVEDPANHDRAALRTRLRYEIAAAPGFGSRLCARAAGSGQDRMAAERHRVVLLAACAVLRPEGFALLPPDLMVARAGGMVGEIAVGATGAAAVGPAARGDGPAEDRALAASCLAALIQIVAGRDYPPPARQVLALLARPRAATLAGVRLAPAGRLGTGWLLVREARAMAPALPALDGAVWDGRFRLREERAPAPAAGWTIGPPSQDPHAWPLDRAAAQHGTVLPALVRATLPCLRDSDGQVRAGEAAFEFAPVGCAGGGALFGAPGPGGRGG